MVALVSVLALCAAGCGGSGRATATGADRSDGRTGTGADRATKTGTGGPADAGSGDADTGDSAGDTGEAATPTPAAVAAGARYDALAAAYAPITARVDFLVAAETLRADAVESGASSDIEKERSGVVKIEVVRLAKVLRAARPKVAAAGVDDETQRRVRTFMIVAIDRRLEALRQLSAMVAATPDDTVSDSEVRRLKEEWRASWDASLRAARDATTTVQDARGTLGLAPAPEEAIR